MIIAWIKRLFTGPTKNLPDHDLNNLLVSSTSTKWEHDYSCTQCHSPVGHEEFMTKICLTCGCQMGNFPSSAAFRYIVRRGVWVRQQRKDQRNLFELGKGEWVGVEQYDKSTEHPV